MKILLAILLCGVFTLALTLPFDDEDYEELDAPPEAMAFPNKNNNINELWEGDIRLTDAQKEVVDKVVDRSSIPNSPLGDIDKDGSTYGLTNVYKGWPNGVVVYTIESNMGSRQRYAVQAAMNSWTKKAGLRKDGSKCISFKQRTNEKDYLSIHVGTGCWCHLGAPNGKNELSCGAGCEYQHVMEHELGHSLGFWHEQSRPDRDSYLQVLWNNVPKQYYEAFAKYGKDKIDSLGVAFDYTSIMQYPWNAFSTTGRDTLRPLRTVPNPGPYRRISPSDIKQARLFYKCGDDTAPTQQPPPPVTKCAPVQQAPCVDKNSACPGWAQRGECTRNPSYMKPNCAKSCKVCTDTGGDCKDSYGSSCTGWASSGECDRNPVWMHKNCMKSCNKCPKVACTTQAPPPPTTKPPPPPTKKPPPPPTKKPPPPPTKKPPPPPTDTPVTQPPIPAGCVNSTKFAAVGMESGAIQDSAITASTSNHQTSRPSYGRLNNRASSTNVGAWCSAIADKNQFFQVDLGKVMLVSKIQIQGREAAPNGVEKFVKKFELSSSVHADASNMKYFYVAKSLVRMEFKGNSDGASVVDAFTVPPLLVRYIRIHPTEWQHDICLRLEIYACA